MIIFFFYINPIDKKQNKIKSNITPNITFMQQLKEYYKRNKNLINYEKNDLINIIIYINFLGIFPYSPKHTQYDYAYKKIYNTIINKQNFNKQIDNTDLQQLQECFYYISEEFPYYINKKKKIKNSMKYMKKSQFILQYTNNTNIQQLIDVITYISNELNQYFFNSDRQLDVNIDNLIKCFNYEPQGKYSIINKIFLQAVSNVANCYHQKNNDINFDQLQKYVMQLNKIYHAIPQIPKQPNILTKNVSEFFLMITEKNHLLHQNDGLGFSENYMEVKNFPAIYDEIMKLAEQKYPQIVTFNKPKPVIPIHKIKVNKTQNTIQFITKNKLILIGCLSIVQLTIILRQVSKQSEHKKVQKKHKKKKKLMIKWDFKLDNQHVN